MITLDACTHNSTLYTKESQADRVTAVATETLETTPKLLLHFDINKTLIAEDLTAGKSIQYIVASLLAEQTVHTWEPDLTPMTYYDYVQTVLVPGPKTPENKKRRREILTDFVNFVAESDYPKRAYVVEAYETTMKKMEGRYLIPSFENLVRKLQEQEIEFKLILRTFGGDLRIGKITDEINAILENDEFKHWGKIQDQTLTLESGESFDDVGEMYRFFRDGEGHIAIQDSWFDWNADEERGRSGKPFMFDPEDDAVLSLFFDDNINPDPCSEFNIVAVMDHSGTLLDLADYMGRQVFIADTIRAILSETDSYYIEQVNRSLSEMGYDVRIK